MGGLTLELTDYFTFYNDERPHQAPGNRTPDQVYMSGQGGRAKIVDKYGKQAEVLSGAAPSSHLVGLPGLVTLRGLDAFTKPQSDKNGDILGFIRYDEEIEPIDSFEGSPDRFVIQIFFDLNLLASFAPAIRPGDKLKLVLTVHELESSSLPDGYDWPSSTVEDYGAILVYGFSVKLGVNRN
jgi:hypothetical protein